MMCYFLSEQKKAPLIEHLSTRRKVFAPHAKGRAFSFDQVRNADDVVLDYPRTIHSVKKFFLPAREQLLSFNLEENSCEVQEIDTSGSVYFGVHSYDLAAVQRLDFNFTDGNPERNYLARRQNVAFVGVSYTPDEHHFKVGDGMDPTDPCISDLFLTKTDGGYVLDVLTAVGKELIEGFELPVWEGSPVTISDTRDVIVATQDQISEIMDRSWDNPVFEEVSEKCVGCGSCNLVCPTCYCFNVEDHVDLQVKGGYRERTWDGCMIRGFSEVAGNEVFREGLAERQRHRLYRKFKYISDVAGHSWCVGCGRCVQACSAGISILDIVNRLVNDAVTGGTSHG